MTIEQVARVVHEANRAYCETQNDFSQRAYDVSPEWQKASARNGVQKILDGTITKPEESHASWLAEKLADGWTFGLVKDVEKKEHPCMVEYDKLPANQQHKDALFFAIVRALAPAIG